MKKFIICVTASILLIGGGIAIHLDAAAMSCEAKLKACRDYDIGEDQCMLIYKYCLGHGV